jgi:preprotein translocase subunit SecG
MANDRTQDELRDRPIGELLKQLSQETTTLVRQELELAKAEMAQKGKRAGLGAGMFGGSAGAALLGLGALSGAAIAALDTAMALWLAALIVALIWLAVAGVLALTGREHAEELKQAAQQKAQETKDTAAHRTESRGRGRAVSPVAARTRVGIDRPRDFDLRRPEAVETTLRRGRRWPSQRAIAG